MSAGLGPASALAIDSSVIEKVPSIILLRFFCLTKCGARRQLGKVVEREHAVRRKKMSKIMMRTFSIRHKCLIANKNCHLDYFFLFEIATFVFFQLRFTMNR